MRNTFVFLLVVFNFGFLLAQKELLNFSSPSGWPTLDPKEVSNDGRYISYEVSSPITGTSLVVEATNRLWSRKILNFSQSRFTEDSRRLIFINQADSMSILDLENDSLRNLGEVANFETPRNGNGEWVAYLLKAPANELIILNLHSGQERHYLYVSDYKICDDGESLVMQTISHNDSVQIATLSWLNLRDGTINSLGQGFYRASKFTFDGSGERLAFLVKENNGIKSTTLRYYKIGMDSTMILVNSSTPGMDGMVVSMSRNIFFDLKGDKIFFGIERPKGIKAITGIDGATVRIQNYLNDEYFWAGFEQEGDPFLSVTETRGNENVICLQHTGDAHYYSRDGLRDDYIVFYKGVYDSVGLYFNRISPYYHDIYFASTHDGTRRLIERRLFRCNIMFSLTGKYAYWYDQAKSQWVTYDMRIHLIKNISVEIKSPLAIENDKPHRAFRGPYPPIGWRENDTAILIQDRYDIWQVDPTGTKHPLNLTNGYGKRNNIELRYLDFNNDYSRPIRLGDTLILSGFDRTFKRNGFFRLIIGQNGNPEKLVMEPRLYFHIFSNAISSGTSYPFFPMKAKQTNVYLVERMSATEYPNLYVTTDFSQFKAMSNLAPQKGFNWLTSELVHWKLFDGNEACGILYKPENFDSRKKYPVIFFYYEKNSDALNYFMHSALSSGAINIPWFVSNGYLVFVPDIYYKDGHPGECAFNSVVSAALYLAKKPFVDGKHMGLQGHSFGGFETNYIVSHTTIFAAAAPSAGFSDIISQYGNPGGPEFFETGQGRIGASLRDRMDLYIENSPIFRTGKVTTPILIMHNGGDPNVSFGQGQEWYYGLSRLRKKVWMLSYDGEGHTIENEQNKLDYSIRVSQFFDHYLKGAPMPKWMTMRVSPYFGNGDNGLELDYDNGSR